MILTVDEINESNYFATMEMNNSLVEEQTFENIPTTREDLPNNYPLDSTYSPNNKVSQLNAGEGKIIGHAKVLEVMQGDTLNFDTKYFFSGDPFVSGNATPVTEILSQLANILIMNPSNSVAGPTLFRVHI